MRVAFLGHSHHRTTGSSAFFVERLRARGEVTTFWDTSWLEGGELDLGPILRGGFDAVVVWQVEALAERLAELHLPNVTFVPMYDGCHAMPDAYWRRLGTLKVLCFSSTLYARLQRLGVRARFVQYFPDPGPSAAATWGGGLRGYFWQRQQDIAWPLLRPLLGETTFDRFTLHRAMDPSFGTFVPPSPADAARFGVRITEWFADGAAQRRDLAAHNVYFAPRLREGIGLSFLEAMALGMLVVAPDQPTMNEYVVSGVNGLLYDPAAPRPLDFARAAELGASARRSVERGFARWSRCVEAVLALVETPTAAVPVRAPLDALDPCALACPVPPAHADRRPAGAPPVHRLEGGARRTGRVGSPAVTIAVVTRNAAATLPSTLESIVRQTWTDREIIVLDGASDDGTVDVIRRYEPALAYWRSERDGGPYEAMNAAAQLAAGRYVLFMNAGDTFHTTDALAAALEDAPPDAGVIFGHHVYRHPAGWDELHRAAPFEQTWAQLRAGDVGWGWLGRVPGHQATLTRTDLLRRNPYALDLRIAADHDLLYRLVQQGVRFHHANAVIATYVGGGLSWARLERTFEEWRRIALAYTEQPEAVARSFAAMQLDVRRDLLARQPLGRLLAEGLWRADARKVAFQRLRRDVFRSRIAGRPLRRTRRTAFALGAGAAAAGLRARSGFSAPEAWGAWTDGPRAALELVRPIRRPRWITLRVVQAYGPNADQELLLRIGNQTFRERLAGGEQRISVKLARGNRAPLGRIELEIPRPTSPRERGECDDARRLGIALRSIEIESRRW